MTAPVVVQKTTQLFFDGVTSASQTITGVTAGNALLCLLATCDQANTPGASTYAAPSGWSIAAGTTGPVNSNPYMPMTTAYIKENCASGSHTFSLPTMRADTYAEMTIIEFGSVPTSGVIGASNITNSPSNTPVTTFSISVTNTVSDSIMVALGSSGGDGAVAAYTTPQTGYTTIDIEDNGGSHVCYSSGYKALSGIASQSAAWSWNGISVDFQALIVEIKGATSGGPLTGDTTETVTSSNTQSSLWVTSASDSESVTSSNTQSSVWITPGSSSESATAITTQNSVWTTSAAQTESATATTTQNSVWIASGSSSESVTSSESQSSVWITPGSSSESATAITTQNSVWTTSAAQTESATSVDAQTLALIASIIESATASENVASQQIAVTSITETTTATDAITTTWTTSASRSESATASESESVAWSTPVSNIESASATETESVARIVSASSTESASATETESSVWNTSASLIESNTSVANQLSGSVTNVAITEPIRDFQTNQLTFATGLSLNDSLSVYNYSVPSQYQQIVATAGQLVFNTTISTIAASAGNSYLMVFLNGIFQKEVSAYSVTGANQITLDSAASVNDEIVIVSRPLSPWSYEAFVSTAGQTVFNTSMFVAPISGAFASLTVFVNGIFQDEGDSYTVSGAHQVTFTAPLLASDDVTIYRMSSGPPTYQEITSTSGQTVFNTLIPLSPYNNGQSFVMAFATGIYQQELVEYNITGTQAPLTEFTSSIIGQISVVVETATITDSSTKALIISSSATNVVTASETETAIWNALASRTEAASAAESAIGGWNSSSSRVEASALSEGQSATNISANTIVELAPITGIEIPAWNTSASITEPMTAGDPSTGNISSTNSVSEGATSTSTQLAGITPPVSTIVEAITASTAQVITFNAIGSATEAASAIDTATSTINYASSIVETLFATDFSVVESGNSKTVVEDVIATETQNGIATMFVADAETSNISDAQSSLLVSNVLSSEGVIADAAQTTIANLVGGITELLTSNDIPDTSAIYLVSVTESVTATSDEESNGNIEAGIIETATAIDSRNTFVSYLASIAEAVAAGDISNSLNIGNVFVTEISNAAQVSNSAQISSVSVTESVSASDISDGLKIHNVFASEVSSAIETSDAQRITSRSVNEIANITETQIVNLVLDVLASEEAVAQDISSANIISTNIVTESLSATSQINAVMALVESHIELANATSSTSIYDGIIYDGSIDEIVDAIDLPVLGYIYDTLRFEQSPALDICDAERQYDGNEYAGEVAYIEITYPFNTNNMEIHFLYGRRTTTTAFASKWEEVYTGPKDKMFLDPVANADLISSFIENEPIETDVSLLRSIINLDEIKVEVRNLE
jgi:hypothetical protein